MTKVRKQHVIPRLKRLVKRVFKKCPGCKRFQAVALATPTPELLPQDRAEGSYPFEVVGVDFAGPIKFQTSTKRERKAYIILFACSLTRALHLDLARSMETAEFPLSLKGLITRRGKPFQEQTGECVVKVELYCVMEVFFNNICDSLNCV